MNWLEKIPWTRIVLGIAIIWGFVAIITYMLTNEIPAQNKEIVLSMTAVLGTALGAVVNAEFRNNQSDETKNRTIETLANTAAAPITKTTVETVTDGQLDSRKATGGDSEVAPAATAVEPIAPADDDGDGFPDEPPSIRMG